MNLSQTAYGKLAALTPPAAVAPLVEKVLAELHYGVAADVTILKPANVAAHTVSEIVGEIARTGQAVLTRYGGVTTKSLWTQIGVPGCT